MTYIISMSPELLYTLCFTGYLLLASTFRFRRAKFTPKRHGMERRDQFCKMTTDQAQSILKDLVELEFPKLMGFSIVFALFKTYGVPSVSSLLVSTGELTSTETTSKRTADTGVLLLEFCLNKPSSRRTLKAISRMNFLHSRYQKAGKISNDDMLYTLSLFALEPGRWIQRYEWRSLTELEMAACGTFWKAMGDAMGISYAHLPSSKGGWADGLHWLNEVESWSQAYEITNMVPAESNQRLAQKHLDLLFFNVPTWLRDPAIKVVAVLVGERLQQAMMLPVPSAIHHYVINCIFTVRKIILRHMFLPRPEFMRKKYIPDAPDPKTARYNSVEYLSHPWYVKPTFKRRWGPRAWMTRILGRYLPGDNGNQYAPEGYLFEEIGPETQKGKGIHEMQRTEGQLMMQDRGKCPFHI